MAIYPVILDKLYENMDEASVGRWLVTPGQKVRRGDVVGELVSDKMNAEVEAPDDAYVADILIPENETVPFGTVLVVMTSSPGEAYDRGAFSRRNQELKQKAEPLPAVPAVPVAAAAARTGSAAPGAAFKAAPAARLYARKLGIDLQDVADFIRHPVIHRQDVQAYWDARQSGAVGTMEPVVQTESLASRPEPAKLEDSTAIRRTALITGASGGIGSAVARTLAAAGCNLLLQGNSHPEKLQALADDLKQSYSIQIEILQADLLNPDSLNQFVKKLSGTGSGIDILINAAGMIADAPIPYMSDDQWNQVLQLNLTVPFQLIRELAMPMARKKWGRIVNIASDAGRMGSANRANYAAAKAGLLGLTRSAAQEFANMGVTVNAVSPGFVDTEMTAGIPDRRRQDLCRTIPVHRFGNADEVAALVKYLVSEEADYTTGQTFSINGGLSMR